MNIELVENIEKSNAKYFLGDEENNKLGINPSGQISGSAAYFYDPNKSIESVISYDHFSLDVSGSDMPIQKTKALENEVKHL